MTRWTTLSVEPDVAEKFREFRDQRGRETTTALRELLDARDASGTLFPTTGEQETEED